MTSVNESSSANNGNGAGSRASNIQKILDRKQKIFQLPRSSKMVKISTYSTCEASENSGEICEKSLTVEILIF